MPLTNDYYDTIDVNVRWSDRQDLVLTLSPTDTLQTVKEKVSPFIELRLYTFLITFLIIFLLVVIFCYSDQAIICTH